MQSVRNLVSRVYYTHGLFCASHPISILVLVCGVIVVLCYPLGFTPLPGNIPAEYVTPVKGYQVPPDLYEPRRLKVEDMDVTSIPRWYKGSAVGYIQQVVVKATVSPWEPTQHDPLDALRAPLGNVFQVLESVNKFTHHHGEEERSMVNCCLRVSEPLGSKRNEGLLPKYACLVLSPANLWQKNLQAFLDDKEILKTIHQRYSQALEISPGIRDILFGLPWRQTGISRYFIRNRQRTISFAITLVLKSFDESFVGALRENLESTYMETGVHVNNSEIDQIVHLHYKNVNIYFEYIHLIVLYLVLLLYLYFSVKKIEMVKSKWGLALSAVVTVVSSLLISVSVCSIFGLNTHLNGGEIFPYLVVLIGMENVLVVTKSVVSTSIQLDVKYRVATGLSKEGWYITKNLLTELAIVLGGFFTFVPAIQEFSLFALVGLLTDFFLQMIFFVTVLSVDIRRMELSDLHKKQQESSSPPSPSETLQPLFRCPFKSGLPTDKLRPQARPQPCLYMSTGIGMISGGGQNVTPRVQQEEVTNTHRQHFLDLPRRLRLIYFWASTRVVQRFIMVCSVIWIGLLVYKTGLVHHLTNSKYVANDTLIPSSVDDLEQIIKLQEQPNAGDSSSKLEGVSWLGFGLQDDIPGSVKHTDLESWRQLSHAHWITMFGYYNITITGKYVSILPTIHLSVIVPPEEAIRLRLPNSHINWPHTEKTKVRGGPKLPTVPTPVLAYPDPVGIKTGNSKDRKDASTDDKSNADVGSVTQKTDTERERTSSILQPDFFSEEYLRRYYPYMDPEQLKQFYPKSHKEFVITVSLGFLSVICITYFMMILYRCMCSRKYSKWRASWSKVPRYGRGNSYYKQIKESIPIVLKGHVQEIECLVTNGGMIVSSCLGGQLRVWDAITGECLHIMQRKSATPPMRRKPCEGRNVEDSEADLYAEYHGNHDESVNEGDDLDLYDNETPRPRQRKRERRNLDIEANQDRFENIPDFSGTIDLNFTSTLKSDRDKRAEDPGGGSKVDRGAVGGAVRGEVVGEVGYDFKGKFGELYQDHAQQMKEKQVHDAHHRSFGEYSRGNRSKSWSEGDFSLSDTSTNDSSSFETAPSSIWCLACKGNLIVAGCGNGKLEFWDSTTGALKCLYSESSVGVTAVNFVNKRVVAARLDGSIDFLELETFQDPKSSTPLSPSSLNKKIKGHSRHLSHSRTGSDDIRLWNEIIHCTLVQRTQAHQRPITMLHTEGGRIISGSQDFTLKVFRLEDYRCLYTLHGHTGCVTVLYLDKCPPYAAVSGSADGTLRIWDLLTGTCVHKIAGHEGTVVGLTCTDMYAISSGLDDKLCVWERKRGQLLYSVDIDVSCGTSMAMLSTNFLITSGEGSLYLWDVHKGELVRVVNVQNRERIAFIHHIQSMENSTIVCDYANEIKVIHFPIVLEKRD